MSAGVGSPDDEKVEAQKRTSAAWELLAILPPKDYAKKLLSEEEDLRDTFENTLSGSSSTLEKLDLLLLPRKNADCEEAEEETDSKDEDAEHGQACSGVGAEAATPRKKNKRPCKSKRLRYRKLVTELEEMAADDPENFHFEQVRLPPSLAGNERLQKKIQARLERASENARHSNTNTAQPPTPPMVRHTGPVMATPGMPYSRGLGPAPVPLNRPLMATEPPQQHVCRMRMSL
mmetsp:Transcript_112594/g.359642  ORF Transcript_112594/g.359642 Transcript_112594/m.359642 type:complete len:233 (-) Transcript_112594:31-729(-)